MKKILICVLGFISITCFAQDEAETTGYGSGGMFYLQPGGAFRLPNNLGTELNTLLREQEDYPQILLMAGGGGLYKFKGKIVLSASGYALIYPPVDGNTSTVDILAGGGDVNVGYTLLNNGKFLGYPRIGIGMLNYLVTIDNFGDFLINQPPLFIGPNEREKIDGTVVYVDIGIDIFRSLIPIGGKGLAAGLSIGYQQSVTGTMWETEEGRNLDNLTDPELSNFYLKLNIGWGGFN